jgi:AcrR family transcriptional regulator
MPPNRQSPDVRRESRAAERDGFGQGHVTGIQRARMIAAMIDAISERGRSRATVAHVVGRSGVSRRTFYEVFDDFEDCFLAALEQSLARASEYVLTDYRQEQRWSTRIRAGLVGLLEFLEDEPAMGRLCIVETLGAGRKVDERRQSAVDTLIATVDEGRAEARAAVTLPELMSEGVVGGVLSVLHARLLSAPGTLRDGDISHDGAHADERRGPLLDLTGSLMGMIVLPFLGSAAAKRESARATPERHVRRQAASTDPLRDLEMRLTYRTVRVLLSIAAAPGASNREVGAAAGIEDPGQISKLLSRLGKLGLVENSGVGLVRGAPNAWTLTEKGLEVERLVGGPESFGSGLELPHATGEQRTTALG